MENIVTLILALSPIYKYGALFLLVMIEGPIVSMIAGLLASQGVATLWLAYAFVVVADVSSDLIYFSIGWFGINGLVRRNKAAKPLKPQHQKLIQLFRTHPVKAIVLGKLTHVFGVPVLIMAGSLRVSFIRFLGFNALATLPKSLIFVLIGYYAGHLITRVNQYLEFTVLGGFLLVAILIVYVAIGRIVERRVLSEKN